jgi:hypothetical protein
MKMLSAQFKLIDEMIKEWIAIMPKPIPETLHPMETTWQTKTEWPNENSQEESPKDAPSS